MSSDKTRLVVLASGRGSNLQSILKASANGNCNVHVVGIVSDRASAKALELGRDEGIPTEIVSPRKYADRGLWDEALAQTVKALGAEFVVLAGFMRIIGEPLLEAYLQRIINVHPSLLPAFVGLDAPAQAIAAGVRVSGCTVHLVDKGMDTGPILAQAVVPVQPMDDPQTLHTRIQKVEHALLPFVLDRIARGELAWEPRPHLTTALAEPDAQLSVPGPARNPSP